MREFHSRRLLGICVFSILCLILLSPTPSVAQIEPDDLTGAKVAVYNGTGEMNSSRIALIRMFEWMGASVVEVNASQILDDFLDDCDMIVFPGGSESSYMIDLQFITGIEKIQDFVENGGSYFGICGGSTFGAMTVDLFDGNMYSVNEPGDTIHMSTMNVNQSSNGPDLSDYSANFTTMYYASQFFVPTVRTDVHVVAKYDSNNQPGMIAFEYGDGTVFLSSPHPEYEEDSDRDDTTFGDDLDDPDSEWDLLFRVSKWLIEASIVETVGTTTATTTTTTSTTTNTTTTDALLDLPLIAVATIGVAVIVLVVATLYQRTR
ncbi:MAG: BPL-N domain-containing protein [Candidatus Thorarchaeota archaeon]